MEFLDTVKMLCKYVVAPRTTGSLCPSSRYLARRMASTVKGASGVVVELGAGTGAITEYLIEAGIGKDSKLYCIEFDKSLSEILVKRYPNVSVINGSAENIRSALGDDAANITAIVSGLPLVSLPKEIVKNILNEVEESLPKGGKFVQFTYNLGRKPESLGFTRMKHHSCSFVTFNVFPARVDLFIRE